MPFEKFFFYVFGQLVAPFLAEIFQIPLSKRWVLTVYGATSPTGSSAEETIVELLLYRENDRHLC